MAVRDHETPSELLLGSRGRAIALAMLLWRAQTLAEISSRGGASKSTIHAALAQLEAAGAVVRDGERYALTDAGARLARDLRELDGVLRPRPTPLAPYRGQWVALNGEEQVVDADADPKTLVRRLRADGVTDYGIMFVPPAGTPASR